jgi:hypothetical protein
LKDLWLALASPDGAAALKAVRRLARSPEQALPHFREQVGKQPAADPDRLARLIADLDAESFEKREAAGEELARLPREAVRGLGQAREGRGVAGEGPGEAGSGGASLGGAIDTSSLRPAGLAKRRRRG